MTMSPEGVTSLGIETGQIAAPGRNLTQQFFDEFVLIRAVRFEA